MTGNASQKNGLNSTSFVEGRKREMRNNGRCLFTGCVERWSLTEAAFEATDDDVKREERKQREMSGYWGHSNREWGCPSFLRLLCSRKELVVSSAVGKRSAISLSLTHSLSYSLICPSLTGVTKGSVVVECWVKWNTSLSQKIFFSL